MAEALICVLLEQLASIIHQQVQLEVNLVGNVKKEVGKLIGSFGAIEAVLKDAEERQVKETSVRFWLDRLKDVSYEVEDVLDEWNTEIQRVQIEKEGGNASVATTKMVSQCIPTPFFCCGQVSRVIFPHDIPGKIQELNERLASIVTERQNYNFQNTKSGGIEQIKRQKTTSFVDETFGRVDEKQLLVSKLLSESSQEGKTPCVIPIVGMGGIGKTTLAQLAYNDEVVKANFTKLIWVCVSDPFDEINIAKVIIEDLNKNDAPNSNDLQALLKCVHRNIKGQKFLLVLDDVWNEDYTKWEKVKVSLQNGAIGSRILVTTRNEKVAMMMATPNNIIHLKLLSEQNCWSIFYYMALADRERDESRVLEPFGKEIVKKCRGLPLVAKTLGGLMRYKKTKKEWQVILNSKIWELDIFENHVFQPLFLSYHDLAPTIKRCLLYCVTFPKDHKIDKDILIILWMSQGYISSNANKENTMMDIGELYFNHLVMRSFFQDFKKDEVGNIECCKMHDIVHDFLQFLTKDECFIVGANGGEEKIALPVGKKFRHLTITFAGKGPFPVSFDNCKSMRTITTFNCKITSLGNPELILQLKCVRTLNLSGNWLEEVPKEVGGLVHLRYLDLSCNNGLKKLPDDTLCKLVNLQTLRLVECRGLEELPEEMGKLTNLRHLHVWGCQKLKLPKTIGRLTSLETLDMVNIWGHDDVIDNNKQVFKLSDLTNMDHLKGSLRIRWRNNKEWKDAASDADKAKLVNKKHLLSLELWFWNEYNGSMIQEEIVSALQPNPNLESLYISHYSGTTLCPHWMKNMNNFTRLEFYNCPVCEFVPLSVLGNLGSLETLRFGGMWKVKKVEFENSTSSSSLEQVLFPSLKHLQFDYMPEWEEWSDLDQESHCVAMPCLSTLSIDYCDKLKALPHFLRKTQLRELTIDDCGILRQSCKNRQGKEWPNISHIPNIQIDFQTVQKDGVWIQHEEDRDWFEEEEEEGDWIEDEDDEETDE